MTIDLIIHNATVRTLDPAQPIAQAVAVSNGKIAAVGTLAQISSLDGAKGATTLDLKGGLLLPGLNDAHTHFLWWAQSLKLINLVGVQTLEAALAKVQAQATQTSPDQWLRGYGWDKNFWGGLPTRADLDRVAPGHPVVLDSKDGHVLWANSKALEIIGINRDTADVAGGEIVRDVAGEPTGIFKENATSLLRHYLNKLEPDLDTATRTLAEAQTLAHQYGLTGVHAIEAAAGFGAFQNLHAQGKLKLRTTIVLRAEALAHVSAIGLRTGFGDEMLWLGQLKFFLDGTLGSQTAAMLEPFDHCTGDHCRGLLTLEQAEFTIQARTAVQAGFGVAVHVIGDRAAQVGLEAIAAVRNADTTGRLRHRLEHVQLTSPTDLLRFAQLGVIASVQPTHATTDRDNADYYWGAERASRAYAYQSLLKSGAHLALGSDAPIEPLDPRFGIYAAVTRQRQGEDRPGWYVAECLSVEEAVRGFTEGPAYAAGDEQRRGRIAPGYQADFTALAQDIFSCPAAEIPLTPITATLVGGEIVYSALT